VQLDGPFTPFEKGAGGNTYERKLPVNFSGGDDDLFMRSIIANYALEAKDGDGKPSGNFFLDETQAKAAAAEVLATHKGLVGKTADAYMNSYWAKSWSHFDVNGGGSIEAVRAP